MKAKDFLKLRLGKPTRLTAGLTDHEHPSVSPDAQHLAYYVGEYGSIQIVVTDMDGKLARRVSPHGGNNTQPAWHPSGMQVGYRHQHTIKHKWEIWVADLLEPEPKALLADGRWHYKHPSWSPEGARLAYFSDEGSENNFHLWLLDLTSGEHTQLTHSTEQNHCHPVFSPDGRKLIYHAYEGTDLSKPPVTNIYELELASGEVRQLTDGGDQYKHPFYLTNGIITYHHEEAETGTRWLEAMRIKGRETVMLTTGKNNDKHPYPFYDAKGRPWLAFSSKKLGGELEEEPNTYDIFLSRLKGI